MSYPTRAGHKVSGTSEAAAYDTENKLRSALQTILHGLEDHPLLNEEIVEEVMRGDHTLEIEIGGDEATISAWAAIARKALQ